MEDKKILKHLFDLAVAGLISEGEFDQFSPDLLLNIPFSKRKRFYLSDLSTDRNLNSHVVISSKKEQFTIHSHTLLKALKMQWYEDKTKIFSSILDPQLISLDSIIICINLFGSRRLETISIPTSIDKDYIKVAAYCIEQHINVPVLPSANQIKITNIPQFINSVVSEIPAIHSAELINFLTEKEKKRLIEGVLI